MQKKHNTSSNNSNNSVIIVLPDILFLAEIENNYKFRNDLLTRIEEIHSYAKQHKKICLDFSSTKQIFSHAMLLLYAELHNLKNIYPNIKFSCKKSREMRVNHVLRQLDLFSLFNTHYPKIKFYKNVDYWKTSSGKFAIEDSYQEIFPKNNILDEETSENLYSACNEATINSVNHAYIDERKLSPVLKDKEAWWGFSEETDEYLSVSICDLGVGIPATIPSTNKAFKEIFKELFDKENHGEIIARAIENYESRTKEKHRGNGLKTIANFAKNNNNISLAIYSSKGIVDIQNKNTTNHNCKKAIQGTIISWKIMKNGVTQNER